MRDEPTQYFRRSTDYNTDSSDDYLYDGYSGYNNYGYSRYNMSPNQYSDSRRYNSSYVDPKYIPPYNPGAVYSQPQYPQTYHDPYASPYDNYNYHPKYDYNQRQPGYYPAPSQQTIPPYEPELESRRNDRVGLLNSDLFKKYDGYSQPITQKYEKKYMPPTNTVYSKSNPIVGGMCNNYTRPPRPRDPQINWSECLSKDKTNTIDYDYKTYDYGYEPAPKPVPVEESWSEIVQRNFSEDL